MPAAKPKTKRTTKAKPRDNGLWRKWANASNLDPEEREYMRDYYFLRRHLATAIDGGRRRPKYEIEFDEWDQSTGDGLELIFKRDGAEIFNEVARRSLIEVLRSIEYVGGSLPKRWRSMLKELFADRHEEEAPDRVRRRARRGARPAIAIGPAV
jgi:hypothetical protein